MRFNGTMASHCIAKFVRSSAWNIRNVKKVAHPQFSQASQTAVVDNWEEVPNAEIFGGEPKAVQTFPSEASVVKA